MHVNTKKIRILMIERGIRPVDLATKWGVSDAAVSLVINGKRPSSLLLGKLAKELRVRLQDIVIQNGDGNGGGR